ncbi:MAG: hypothetical protein H7235_06545 [Bdellovibrionaceae bacterium]|nr:hypothetical protein [Pseudobdellovibrionaceae bacterium]
MKNTKNNKVQSTTGNMTDTLKKIMSAGSASDISKELLHTALGQVNKTKDDISAKVTNEMIALIRKIDFVKEFSKFAENHKFKISAEVEIIKKNK